MTTRDPDVRALFPLYVNALLSKETSLPPPTVGQAPTSAAEASPLMLAKATPTLTNIRRVRVRYGICLTLLGDYYVFEKCLALWPIKICAAQDLCSLILWELAL